MSDPNRKQQKADALAFKERQHTEATAGLEFRSWPKIFRFQRDIVITEKIDGTNAAIGVTDDGRVYAQSRNNLLSPYKDNAGFAQWVTQHANVLRDTLGPGLHFGEWWGVGIQRGYGLSERRFSLFNSYKWGTDPVGIEKLDLARRLGVSIYCVPILYRGPWEGDPYGYGEPGFVPDLVADRMRTFGSQAAPVYMDPEGIVIFHEASGHMYKWTFDGDGHKGTI